MNTLSIILAAVIPITATTQATKSVNISAYHGESIAFETTYLDALGNPIEDISVEELYFQTNGMGQIWFKAKSPSSFGPSDDIGAANYRFFLRAESPDGVNYRANGNLRMLDSPGFTPAELSLPAKSIDFSIIDVKNAPWALFADLVSLSNRLDGVAGDATKAFINATNAQTRANNAIIASNEANTYARNAKTIAQTASDIAQSAKKDAQNAQETASSASLKLDQVENTAEGANAAANAALSESSNALCAISTINENLDTKIKPQIATNTANITTCMQILEGKNFRIVVSNHTEKTAISSYEILDNGAWKPIWNETNLVADAIANLQSWSLSNHYTKAESDATTAATRKWSNFDSVTGEEAPEGFTQISSENGIMLGAGLGYFHVAGSQYWILRGNGSVNVNTNGLIEICDSSGQGVFRCVKGDEELKGASPTENPAIQHNVDGFDIITIYYSFTSGKAPIMEFTEDLKNGPWYKDTDEGAPHTVTWEGSVATVKVPTNSAGFFRAFYWAGGENYVESTQAMKLSRINIGGTTYTLGTATISGKTVLTLE